MGAAALDAGGRAPGRLFLYSVALGILFLFQRASSPFAFFLLIAFFAVHILFLSQVPFESFQTITGWLPGLLVLASLWNNEPDRQPENQPKRLAVFADILAVVAILSTGPGVLGIWVTQSWSDTSLVGTFYWHNQLAIFLVMVLLPFGVRLLMVKTRARLSYLLVLAYLLVAFVMARSVGALLSLLIGATYIGVRLWAIGSRRNLWIPLFPLALLLALLPFRWLYEPYVTRVVNVLAGGHSTVARLEYWKAAWNIFLHNPLLGTGLGSFGFLFPAYQRTLATFSDDPHNLFLQILAETGLCGAIFIAGFLGWLGWNMMRTRPPPGARPLAFALEGAYIAGVSHALVDFDWKFPALVMTLFLIAGIRIGLVDRSEAAHQEISRSLHRKSRRKKVPRSFNLPSVWQRRLFIFPVGLLFLFWGLAIPGILALKIYSRNPALSGTAEGRKSLKRTLRLFPWNTQVLYLLARDSMTAEPEEGRAYAQRAVKLNPLHPEYRMIMAEYAIRDGDLEIADAEMRTALRIDPWNRPHFYLEYAHLRLARYDLDGAQETLEKAIQIYPFKTAEQVFSSKLEFRNIRANLILSEIHQLLAQIYEIRGDPARAKEHQEWAMALKEET